MGKQHSLSVSEMCASFFFFLSFLMKMEYSRGAGRYRAGVMPSRVSNDTKTFKFAAGPSRHGSRVFVLLTVLIVGPLLAASYSCSSLLFLTWMSGLWVFSVLGVVTILRDGGVKPRVTQHAPSQSGTSPQQQGWPVLHRQYSLKKLLINRLRLLQLDLICFTYEDGTVMLSRNAGNQVRATPCYIP